MLNQQEASDKMGNRVISKSRSILKLDSAEARRFFLKADSYFNFDLPIYIVFDKLLEEIDKCLSGKNLSDFILKGVKPQDYENLNHVILNNKDGKYAWRPMQLIHPAVYVSLVHKITEQDCWEIIRSRFSEFSKNPKIECISQPVEALTAQKDKAEQIIHWWQEVEQRSIEFGLDFEYLIQTDITDCYGSIYTHSIAWALHGKDFAKENRNDKNLIGNFIDAKIQSFSHGQTNGIPQGSVLMDFVAEMVLGYADMELSSRIEDSKNIDDYHIIRYRDDYRIFVNNPQDGEKIIKFLTEIMISLGLKLNSLKTKFSNHVIRDSIKADKLHWIGQKQRARNLQKHLLIIHELATEFPNSGSLTKALAGYYKRIASIRRIKKESLDPLISIATDIAYHNPKTYANSATILSKFISLIEDDEHKREIINKIKKKFDHIPNTGHLQIWLQRITIKFDKSYDYEETLCKAVAGGSPQIWNSEWLSPTIAGMMQAEKIIDQEKIEMLPPVISNSEVELFTSKFIY